MLFYNGVDVVLKVSQGKSSRSLFMPFFFCSFEFGSCQRLWQSPESHGSAGLRVSLPSIFLVGSL